MAGKVIQLQNGPHDGSLYFLPDDRNELIVLRPSEPLYGDRIEDMHPEVISTDKGVYRASVDDGSIFLWQGWV